MSELSKIVIIQAGTNLCKGMITKFPYTNLTCASIAAAIPETIQVEIIDMFVQEINYEKVEADLALITTLTPDAYYAFEVASMLKKKGIPVIGGGVHVVVQPDECEKHFDAIAIGEAELLLEEIINDFEQGELKKRYEAQEQFDLTQSKLPRYDLLPLHRYNFFSIMASKGCQFDCDFCSSRLVTGKGFRHKTVEQVINEILYIQKLHEKDPLVPDTFYFIDSNLYTDRGFLIELLQEMIPLKLKPWGLFASVNVAYDQEVLDLLQQANCEAVQIGFESVNSESLKSVNKKQNNPARYKEIVENLSSRGIYAFGSFIFGFDDDTVDVFDETIHAIKEADFIYTGFFTLTPFPGTRVYNRLTSEGRILHTDWSRYNMEDVVFLPKKMSINELESGVRKVRYNSTEPHSLFQSIERFNQQSGKTFKLEASKKIALIIAYMVMYFKFTPRTRYFIRKIISSGKLMDYNNIMHLLSRVQSP